MSLARLSYSLLQNCYDNGTMRSGKKTFFIQDGDDFGNIDLHVNAAKGAHYTRNMEGGGGYLWSGEISTQCSPLQPVDTIGPLCTGMPSRYSHTARTGRMGTVRG